MIKLILYCAIVFGGMLLLIASLLFGLIYVGKVVRRKWLMKNG